MILRKTYPGVDVRTARSRLIDENRIAAEDVTLARTAKDTIATARGREDHSELARDLVLIDRARKLQAFFSQPFYVAEPFTKRPGSHVSRADACAGLPRKSSTAGSDDPSCRGLLLHWAASRRSRRAAGAA